MDGGVEGVGLGSLFRPRKKKICVALTIPLREEVSSSRSQFCLAIAVVNPTFWSMALFHYTFFSFIKIPLSCSLVLEHSILIAFIVFAVSDIANRIYYVTDIDRSKFSGNCMYHL